MLETIQSALDLAQAAGYFQIFLVMIGGLLVGTFLGAMPGITASIAVALMFPISVFMHSLLGIIFLSSIYTGGVYGGGVMATAFNIPGSAGSVATSFDGYPMTRKGKFYEAVGYGLCASMVGCFVAYLSIFFLLVPIGSFALRFGPPEMAMLALAAFTIIGLVTGNIYKSVVSGFTGLLIGSIGTNFMGMPRGTFGRYELFDGINVVVLIIGLFAIAEAFSLILKKGILDEDAEGTFLEKTFAFKEIIFGMKNSFKYIFTIVKSLIIGLIIGLVPAAGSTVASVTAYGQAKSSSKEKEKFGKGAPEGIISAESANNSAEAGAMATMLCFGIPGSAPTAVLLGAFIVHGIMPGPYLVRDNLDFAYAIIVSNLFQAFLLFFAALALIFTIGKVIKLSSNIIVPFIVATSIVGTFATRQIFLDLPLVLFFGGVGYIMKRIDYPILSLLMGVILAKIVEGEVYRSYNIFSGAEHLLFIRPIFLILLAVTIISVIYPLVKKYLLKMEN